MNRFICVHGHFYQPPRENPWIEEIEQQDSAHPYHDWNKRIHAECYGPNACSRILDRELNITNIVNNYAKINFDFGPTLLSWMERHEPETYEAILEADRESCKNFSGHGAAIAQCYNHMIMPLANARDKRTQVVWGIRDFESRFGRKPEGMWLPETAVDLETLEILVERGILFTVLAPNQAKAVHRLKDKTWKDVSGTKVDPKRPYLCHLPSGKTISVFFYDGNVSHDVAFAGLLKNGEEFARRLTSCFVERREAQLVNIATDGETYGHHHGFGNMALSYCLYQIEKNPAVTLTVYGEFLEKFPPVYEAEILERSAWSCSHGVDRWRKHCGCHTGGKPGWNQEWRSPLREALDWVRDQMVPVFESQLAAYVKDPWLARDDYIEVILDRSRGNTEKFLDRHARKELFPGDKIQALKLLEMQRQAMLMYTSCGWFFDEISGIETVQIMQYAKRAMDLCREVGGPDLEGQFLEYLQKAVSNIPEYGNGAKIYEKFVKPSAVGLVRLGGHYALSALFESAGEEPESYNFTVTQQICERDQQADRKMAVGRLKAVSDITWEEKELMYAVFHLGIVDIIGGVAEYTDEKQYLLMQKDLRELFARRDIDGLRGALGNYFGPEISSLWNLFKDEQMKVLYRVLESTLSEIEKSMRQITEYHEPIIQVIKQLKMPLPKIIANTVVAMVDKDLLEVLGNDPVDFRRLEELVAEVKEWGLGIDHVTLGVVVRHRVNALMESWQASPDEIRPMETVEAILRSIKPLSFDLDLWEAQNIYFYVGNRILPELRDRRDAGDEQARQSLDVLEKVGDYLHVKIP
ncbi:MAG: DUF3536 domain-containing protein [Candidatus Omnitrophota bacterium]|nr:DUF3536 domain-containing protein [Candidatus Omnitrophota bacterium]MDZ4242061.1 DUF3536 domain-containing protein [Candidatus Omnitrophota bacterium]